MNMNSNKKRSTKDSSRRVRREDVSVAVVKRLPRYFRYLREIMRMDKMRISSSEMSKMMNVTASQIRQDLNCFGGFGQQGYGYNVEYLYTNICELLGVDRNFKAVIVGAGNLGKALVRSPMFEKRGVEVVSMFDVSETVVGKLYGNVKVLHTDTLDEYLAKNEVDIVVLTLPKDCAHDACERLKNTSIKGIWNFTGIELKMGECPIIVENVHIGDSLMTLCYEIARKNDDTERSAEDGKEE